MMENNTAGANRLKELLIESSPLIEEYTRELCPQCTSVCCKQQHGTYRDRDILYLRALGTSAPRQDEARPQEGPCEMMGPQGCVQPRWMRPFKCTWFFCSPLLAAMDTGPQKKARRLSMLLQEMIDLYNSLSHSL